MRLHAPFLAAGLVLSVPLAALPAELVARQGADWVRLSDAPCTSPAVLQQLTPAAAEHFQAATGNVGGKTYEACWRLMGGAYYLVYEDGDQGVISASEAKEEHGI